MHWQTTDLVDRLAAERRTGLIFVDEYGHRRDYTFAEIAKHSLRYAAVLRAFGVHAEDRVFVSLSTAAKCIFTLLALERVGAQAILDEGAAAGATTVIANRKYRPGIDAIRDYFAPDARYLLIGEACEGWARLDTLAHVAAATPHPPSDEAAAALQAASQRAHARLHAFPTDVVWCAMQIEDGGWFQQAILQPWLCGATAVAHNGAFDSRERLDLIRELDVTILLQRADEYGAQLELQSARFRMPRLRRCIVLGSGTEQLQVQWRERFGMELAPDTEAPSPLKSSLT
jgi:acyl-coenzyme A synthetase/AMP-(fatty) acid ligase